MEEFQDQTGGNDHGDVKLGRQSSASIAPFDHSIDGFVAAMESIFALCGEPSCEAFPLSQIERYSSMIIFLKEWQQFYYEPKVLNFSYESEFGQMNNFSERVTLPQFSSASVSVPKMESLAENVRSSSRSDFVLHVGGSVWALDWCPRTDEKTEGQANCEYLAVAAHPPGASYHKIGVPLFGRGLIQIWCLISMDQKEDLSQAKPQGRGRHKMKLKQTETKQSDDFNQNEFSAIRRKRGRPRKRHAEDDVLHDSDNKKILHLPKPLGRPRKIEKLSTDDLSRGEILPARPRGRPRKHMNLGLNGPDSVNGLILGRPTRTLESMVDEETPLSTDHVILSTMQCVPVVNVDALKHRESPRKKAVVSVDKGLAACAVALDEYAVNDDEILSSKTYITPLDVDSGGVVLASHVSAKGSANSEANAPKRRGRPKRGPLPITNKSLPEAIVELLVDASDNGECQNDVIVSDSCEGVTNEREETMSCSHVPENNTLPRMVLSLAHNGLVAWDVKWRPKTSIKSEGKQYIGYLAVLLGSGSVEVWEVPHPSLVRRLYIASSVEGTDPRFLKLDPVFKCSKIKCGDRQCIPLTLEWSRSGSSDLMLAGCHDGTVVLWKFSSHCPSQDTRPLLCFTADTGPIRALAWAPKESDPESSNLVVTTGTEGLKFWDLRDPHRPLWEPYPVQRAILSLEWTKDPRCVIISLDDGTLRTFSLWDLTNDGPVIGKPSDGMKQPAWHSYYCSSFALWSIQASHSTGLAAYCGAEGSTYYFKLTVNSLKDCRNRLPHILCGSLLKDGETLKISTPLLNSPSLVTKHKSNCSVTSQALAANQAGPKDSKSSLPGNRISFLPEMKKPKSKPKNLQDTSKQLVQSSENGCRVAESNFLDFPPKILAMHRVRWNMNKGSERWLCYGGAAGIVRCQEIS